MSQAEKMQGRCPCERVPDSSPLTPRVQNQRYTAQGRTETVSSGMP